MSFTAAVVRDFGVALDEWERLGAGGGSPFGRRPWLDAWARTMGRDAAIDLLPVLVRDAAGTVVAGLPLVRETRGVRRIGFADGGLVDYNAPVLGRGAPGDVAGALALWRAVLRALPPADVVRFERMPPRLGDRLNPFALLPAARPSSAVGLALALDEGFPGWHGARPRRYRMELGRCGRLFEALPGARFEQVAAADSPDALVALERLQRARMAPMAKPYLLDDPHASAFHALLAANDGACRLFALRAEGRTVAVLFGLRTGGDFIMLRVAADEAYARLSPARLLIVRAMERLAADGVHNVDFGLGDYPYKRRLGGSPVALVDVVVARSARGLPEVGRHRAAAWLKARPRSYAAARGLREALLAPRFRPRLPP